MEREGVKKTSIYVSDQAAHDGSKLQGGAASGNLECKGGDAERCGLRKLQGGDVNIEDRGKVRRVPWGDVVNLGEF